jgi:signal-transduction protein with cAMP-binding, CBS, and nucleotidyltransferase domain
LSCADDFCYTEVTSYSPDSIQGDEAMQFTVGDWMFEVLAFVDPNNTVSEALAVMRRRYINFVIVDKTADSPEYGIITSLDVCDKIIAQGHNPQEVKVRDIMSSPMFTVQASMGMQECAQFMLAKRIHHLPVVDAAGKLVGMIHANDFLVAAEAIGRAPGDRII